MTRYTVLFGFSHEGVFYTRDNEKDVAALPKKVRDDKLARGLIAVATDSAAPEGAAPDPTSQAE